MSKLKQLKLSLKEKLDTLAKLNEEILCETDEVHVEVEIGRADEIRERICLAIITIDEALEVTSAPVLVQDMLAPEMKGSPIQYHGTGEATQGAGGNPVMESTSTPSSLPTITVSGVSATDTPTTTTASTTTTTWPMSVPGSMPAFIFSAFNPEVTIAKASSSFCFWYQHIDYYRNVICTSTSDTKDNIH